MALGDFLLTPMLDSALRSRPFIALLVYRLSVVLCYQITAVVVGGISLLGGSGNVIGTFLGALFIVCLNVLLILKGVNPFVGMGWKGIIILVAVYLQSLGRRNDS